MEIVILIAIIVIFTIIMSKSRPKTTDKVVLNKIEDIPEMLYNEAMSMLTKYIIMPVEQEIKLNYPDSSQLKGISRVDKSRKNGYYAEFYPHGTVWVLSTLNNGVIYTETYCGDTSLTSQSLIKHGKLTLYKMYHPETHELIFHFQQNCEEDYISKCQENLADCLKKLSHKNGAKKK